jgi:hypothetical protein
MAAEGSAVVDSGVDLDSAVVDSGLDWEVEVDSEVEVLVVDWEVEVLVVDSAVEVSVVGSAVEVRAVGEAWVKEAWAAEVLEVGSEVVGVGVVDSEANVEPGAIRERSARVGARLEVVKEEKGSTAAASDLVASIR